jgi:translation initiation factor eIF-2B subunit alpha
MLREQDGNFDVVRQHLVKNGQLFAQRAINARLGVAERGWRFVFPGSTVLTHGASRAVLCLLERAQKERPGQFKVIYVRDEQNPEESDSVVRQLRSWGIPTSAIGLHSVLYAMTSLQPRVDRVFLGGEVITEDGGIISRMGTCQIAQAAQYCNIETYVCGETHKFSAYFPGGPYRVGFDQQINHFTTKDDDKPQEELVDWTVSLSPASPLAFTVRQAV